MTEDAEGTLTFERATGVQRSSDENTDRASTTNIPENAVAVAHPHIERDSRQRGIAGSQRARGLIDESEGLGDAQPLTQGLPSITVHRDRTAVRELVDGRIQIRMLSGQMTRSEERALQEILNIQQEFFYATR